MKADRTTRRAARALGVLALASTASADLQLDWLARLPVGTSLSSGPAGIVVDGAGISYVTGTTGSSNAIDVVTAAFGPDGSLLWSHVFDGPQGSYDQARGIALGPGGRVVVTGNTAGPGSYANVLVLVHDAASGALLDMIQYSSGAGLSEHGASVAVDAQGAMYVGGGTVGDGADGMILKFDATGQLVWKRIWDGPPSAPWSQDHVLQVLLEPGGELVAMIYGVMSNLHADYVVVKYAASTGATLWETNWGTNGDDSPTEMRIDGAGDVYVTGDSFDRYSTIRLRGSDGDLLWQAYDDPAFHDYVQGLDLDGQGGVYVTGGSDPDGDESNSNDNIYTVKRDGSDGALLWSHLYGANCIGCFDAGGDVAVDSSGHVFVAGATSSPPYSGDAITLVLDATTGLETERGVLSGAPTELARSGVQRFDPAGNVLNGGSMYDANSGDIDLAVWRYASLDDCQPTLYCDETQNAENAADIDITSCDLVPGTLVTLSSAPPNQFCYLLIGDHDGVISTPPGAAGDLCVAGGSCIGRYAKDVGATSGGGAFATDISDSASGGPSFGVPTCGGQITSGETWYFQYWHRRPMGQPSSFSSAIAVTFR